MDNPEEMQPLEYKVVETVYNMDDDEFDSIDGDCKNNNKLLRQDLQSLDKNILDFLEHKGFFYGSPYTEAWSLPK